VRPVPRKFVALGKIEAAATYFVTDGTILVTRSGSVGRPTLAHAPHRDVVISDDLLRVQARNHRAHGWLYAYLHTPHAREMARSVHYGHIIKHLEVPHLQALPVPLVDDATTISFASRVDAILASRNEGYRLTQAAEALFADTLGGLNVEDWGETGFSVKASSFLGGRQRLDASAHNPGVAAVVRHLKSRGRGFTTVRESGYDVWVPGRYKRIPAENGVVYRDSADLLEVSPDLEKRFADCGFGDEFGGRVRGGWILVPSSGQVYGIIGTALLATEALDGQVVSNHVLRVAPRDDASVRAGYLVTAMSHLTLGRPMLKSLAFGSSVPEIDSEDLANFNIVRLEAAVEAQIADLAEAAAEARAKADLLERAMAADAAAIIDKFIAG
jgi:hypothetical protein